MKNLLIAVIFCFGLTISAQHRVGVRAGLNYSKFNGPVEPNESYDITGGFHFGINYTYEFTSVFGLRGEILYTQRGTKRSYDGKSYYIVNPIAPADIPTFVDYGDVLMDLKVSNAYLSIPITAQYRLNRKFELFGGISLDFVVGPTGTGKVKFVSDDDPNINFTQSLDYRYSSDVVGQYNTFLSENILVNIDERLSTLPRIIGAYYNFPFPLDPEEDIPSLINGFDSHLIGGVNYFINSGFYVGARIEYGLLDTTNAAVDYSLGELDENENYIFRDDSDKSFNLSLSFGFKF
ncbi:MAG: PorT family protein [Saprospiraceae bacterium]|nr:PorT family protein [Bacteroidia bacterium]NNE16703.1 PorT family protein [Saprospiraceae bacterium]NNL93724.1 PorT family protein [Saprospiraceae bacterium]